MFDLTPIFICVVLPVLIVLIKSITSMYETNKRSQVFLKALENDNTNIDPDKIVEVFKKPQKSALEILNKRLLLGCIFSLVGVGLEAFSLVAYINGNIFNHYMVKVPMIFGFGVLAIGISYLIVYFVTRKQVNENK